MKTIFPVLLAIAAVVIALHLAPLILLPAGAILAGLLVIATLLLGAVIGLALVLAPIALPVLAIFGVVALIKDVSGSSVPRTDEVATV
jgi:hypothetical protein